MLRRAMVSGMPARSRLANCRVYMANSLRPGFLGPLANNRPRPAPADPPGPDPARAADLTGLADPWTGITETGMTPMRSTWATAAARSAASRTPSTGSPERRRAL